MDVKKLKSFKDVHGNPEFYPDAEKIELSAIIDQPIILEDIRILKDYKSEDYGTHDCALFMFRFPVFSDEDEDEDGNPLLIDCEQTENTSICSGVVFVDQCKKVSAKKNGLPIMTTIIKKKAGRNEYYLMT